jgi:hypothetical protein
MIESFLVAVLAVQMAGTDISQCSLDEWLTDEDVVGNWALSPRSLKWLAQRNFRTAPSHRNTLVVRADRSCTLASVDADEQGASYVVLDGTWRLEHAAQPDASRPTGSNYLRLVLRSQCERFPEVRHFDLRRGVDDQLCLLSSCPKSGTTHFIEYTKLD